MPNYARLDCAAQFAPRNGHISVSVNENRRFHQPPGPARLALPFQMWQMSLLEAEKNS